MQCVFDDVADLRVYMNSSQLSQPEPSVRQQAVATGLAFLMAESARRHDRKRRRVDAAVMFRLRDSLSYRAEAVDWHPHVLRVLHSAGLRRLSEAHPDQAEEHQILIHIASEHHYLFDDLVFNALSLFDYVGNAVGFALYGEQRRKAKWDRIHRFAHDPEYESREHPAARISSTELSPCILDVHSSLVFALAEYRAALIHYEAQLGPGEFQINYTPAADGGFDPQYALLLKVPDQFGRRFVVPGYEADPRQATLLDAADWLARVATRDAARVLRALERELRHEAGVSRDGTEGSVEIV